MRVDLTHGNKKRREWLHGARLSRSRPDILQRLLSVDIIFILMEEKASRSNTGAPASQEKELDGELQRFSHSQAASGGDTRLGFAVVQRADGLKTKIQQQLFFNSINYPTRDIVIAEGRASRVIGTNDVMMVVVLGN